jgi:hypothetical protein
MLLVLTVRSDEGLDDMPVCWYFSAVCSYLFLTTLVFQAHIKSSLIGTSINIPIKDGRLATGTWQGIYYLEFRAMRHQRSVIATIQGEKA